MPALAVAATRLENLQIEIWPEYDRPAALVILRGELAADIALPAALSLRIPVSSGGPAAVAYSTDKKGRLLNLKYDRSDAADFITLRMTVPTRFLQVEFYDRLATGTGERRYKYVWPADLPVSWLDVIVQEPAGASNLSVQPELNEGSTGSDGLRYRSAQLGPAKPGAPVPIEIRYSRTDPRTSAEILGIGVPAAPAPGPASAPARGDFVPLMLALGGTALLAAAACVAYFVWTRRRARLQRGSAGDGRFCSQCGNRAAAGDRFCARCGAALRASH